MQIARGPAEQSDENSDDNVEPSQIDFRQPETEEMQEIDTYGKILSEIDKELYSNPYHG